MSFKLTIEKANELFTLLGVEAAVVAEADKADAEPDMDALVAAIQPEADDAAKPVDEDAIKGKVIGAQMGALRSLLMREFSIKRADLDGLDQKDMIPKLKTLLGSRYTQTESELRQQLEESNNALNALEERLNSEWQGKLDAESAKFEERDIQDYFVNTLNKIPRSGGDVLKQAQMALKEAKSDYIVKFNPTTKQVDFYDKANPEAKVMDGKNALTGESFSNKFVDSLGLRVTDTRHINPNDIKNQGGQGRIHNTENGGGDAPKSAIDKMREKVDATLEESTTV